MHFNDRIPRFEIRLIQHVATIHITAKNAQTDLESSYPLPMKGSALVILTLWGLNKMDLIDKIKHSFYVKAKLFVSEQIRCS